MNKPLLVIAGASGIVGRSLIEAAGTRYRIRVLSSSSGGALSGVEAIAWNPTAARQGDEQEVARVAEALTGAQALVNLAGASIEGGRFNAAHRSRIYDSRIDSTTTLVAGFRRSAAPPRAWLQASGIHFYGDRGDELLDEKASKGQGFLADMCEAWEGAVEPVRGHARVVACRFGLVLASEAPLWRRLVTPIKLGVGGRLGTGRQWWSWICAEDLSRALLYLIEQDGGEGSYNLSAPEPVRQLELFRALAQRLRRPAFFPAPAPLLRVVLGGAADALVLASTRVVPAKLQREGFEFRRPTVSEALDKLVRSR